MSVQFNTFFVDNPASTGNQTYAHGLTSPDTSNYGIVVAPSFETTETVNDLTSGNYGFGHGYIARRNAGSVEQAAIVGCADANSPGNEGSYHSTTQAFLLPDTNGNITTAIQGTFVSMDSTNITINWTNVSQGTGFRFMVMVWTGIEASVLDDTLALNNDSFKTYNHNLDDKPEMVFVCSRGEVATGFEGTHSGISTGLATMGGNTTEDANPDSQIAIGSWQDWSLNDCVSTTINTRVVGLYDEQNRWQAELQQVSSTDYRIYRRDVEGGAVRFIALNLSMGSGIFKTHQWNYQQALNVASQQVTLSNLSDLNLGILAFGTGHDAFVTPADEGPAHCAFWGAYSDVSGNEGCVAFSQDDTTSANAWTNNYGIKIDDDADDTSEVLANISKNATNKNRVDIDYVTGKQGTNQRFNLIGMQGSTTEAKSVSGASTNSGALTRTSLDNDRLISYVGGAQGDVIDGSDITLTLPTHQANDFAIITCLGDESGIIGTFAITVATGWTLLDSANHVAGSDRDVAVFYKKLTSASETNPTVTFDQVDEWSAIVSIFRNVDTTDPFDGTVDFVVDSGQNDTNPVPPSITTQTDHACIFTWGGWSADDITQGIPPNGYTLGEGIWGSTKDHRGQIVGYLLNASTAGLKSPTKWENTASPTDTADYSLYTIALKPLLEVQQNLTGASTNSGAVSTGLIISQALEGTSSNSGTLATQALTVLQQALSGVSTNSGNLSSTVLTLQIITGASTNSGNLTKRFFGVAEETISLDSTVTIKGVLRTQTDTIEISFDTTTAIAGVIVNQAKIENISFNTITTLDGGYTLQIEDPIDAQRMVLLFRMYTS